MRKELTHVTNMLPYIPYAASKGETIAPFKSFTISRCKGIPQTSPPTDAGVMTVLLIEAHKDGGVDACKTIMPRVLSGAAKQLVVKFFRYLKSSDTIECGNGE